MNSRPFVSRSPFILTVSSTFTRVISTLGKSLIDHLNGTSAASTKRRRMVVAAGGWNYNARLCQDVLEKNSSPFLFCPAKVKLAPFCHPQHSSFATSRYFFMSCFSCRSFFILWTIFYSSAFLISCETPLTGLIYLLSIMLTGNK